MLRFFCVYQDCELGLAVLFCGSKFFLAGDDFRESWPAGIVATRIFSRYHGLGPRRAHKIDGKAITIEVVVRKQ